MMAGEKMSIESKINCINHNLNLEEVFWEDVRDDVRSSNPELAEICDEINPGKKHPLIKIHYPWGSNIINQGTLFLPTKDNRLLAIDSPEIPESIKKQLNYSPIPLSFILERENEVFVETNTRVIPLNHLKPGEFFGIFEIMNKLNNVESKIIWSVSAGSRSVFMLPKISEASRHKRMQKEFHIKKDAPSSLEDHYAIFKEITYRADHADRWHNSILVFTDAWFQTEHKNSAWGAFNKYLFKVCWIQMQLLRDATSFSLLWALFIEAVNNRNLKPRPYLVDTIKYLVSVASGSGVAFMPSTNESSMPIKIIQDAFTEVYQLPHYIPTIMHSSKLNENNRMGYYSLTFPTILDSNPDMKRLNSIVSDQREIHKLLETLTNTIKHRNPIINPIKNVSYQFYHNDTAVTGQDAIYHSESIIKEDRRFLDLSGQFKDKTFCATSPFFRGCIRILVDNNNE